MSRFPTVAIVGSGPSGCYVAQALQKKWPEVQITILEALPAPYGLVRYGIAADHQGSKSVIQQFERVLSKTGTRFFGNVSVGRDISYDKLVAAFDIVVFAVGLGSDTKLKIPTTGQPVMLGAGTLLKYLNGHPLINAPTFQERSVPRLGDHVCVIGAGNVAIDVARLILKRDEDLLGSDVSDEARTMLGTKQVQRVTVVSRSKATVAKCDLSMLEELLALPGLSVSVRGIAEDELGSIVQAVSKSVRASQDQTGSNIYLDLVFNATPLRVNRRGKGAEVLLVNSDQVEFSLHVDTVVTAIGFDNSAVGSELLPPDYKGEPGIYKVGWYHRGPRGTVAENRKDAKIVADTIINEFDEGLVVARKVGYESLRKDLPTTAVDFNGWKKIDQYELATAGVKRCRRKVTDIQVMLRLAHDDEDRAEPVSDMPALIA
ncbi:FAD-dependent oxidoreductase [Pseudomonas sp. BGM005]|nr:FAD-dependent oxidoreductase [Pseudomonas sp. BG5]